MGGVVGFCFLFHRVSFSLSFKDFKRGLFVFRL